MIEVKAPMKFSSYKGFSIFLAGSIDMGSAENWQDTVCDKLSKYNLTALNPRRDDWDSGWVQSIHNEQFREQVEWELAALESSDRIMLYLAPGTKSPISLLELGLFAHSGKLIVGCPEGYWRRGNVEIVCKKYNIPLVFSLTALIDTVVGSISSLGYW